MFLPFLHLHDLTYTSNRVCFCVTMRERNLTYVKIVKFCGKLNKFSFPFPHMYAPRYPFFGFLLDTNIFVSLPCVNIHRGRYLFYYYIFFYYILQTHTKNKHTRHVFAYHISTIFLNRCLPAILIVDTRISFSFKYT